MTAECQFETLYQCHLRQDKQESLEVINHNCLLTAQSSAAWHSLSASYWEATCDTLSLWHFLKKLHSTVRHLKAGLARPINQIYIIKYLYNITIFCTEWNQLFTSTCWHRCLFYSSPLVWIKGYRSGACYMLKGNRHRISVSFSNLHLQLCQQTSPITSAIWPASH